MGRRYISEYTYVRKLSRFKRRRYISRLKPALLLIILVGVVAFYWYLFTTDLPVWQRKEMGCQSKTE